MTKQYYVYILTNYDNTVLYIGVTRDLSKRVWEHKEKLVDGFTKKYHVWKLIYYEVFSSIEDAINREKQLKKWRKEKKFRLTKKMNPNLQELRII